MKRLLTLLILLIASVSWAGDNSCGNIQLARMSVVTAGGRASAALSCNTTTPYAGPDSVNDNFGCNAADASAYCGQGAWTPASGTITVCQVSINIAVEVGTIDSKYFRVQILDYNGTTLNNVIGTSDVIQFSTTGVKVFSFTTKPDLTAGTNYAVMLEMSDSNSPFTIGYDTSNYPKIAMKLTSGGFTGGMAQYAGTSKGQTMAPGTWDAGIYIYTMQ
jgi:hypothetical protein